MLPECSDIVASFCRLPFRPTNMESIRSCNEQRGAEPCSRMRWQKKRNPRTKKRFWAFPYLTCKRVSEGSDPITLSGCRRQGIMRGFTGLIITTCQFKHKNTDWTEKMKRRIRICSIAVSELPSLCEAGCLFLGGRALMPADPPLRRAVVVLLQTSC